MVYLGFKIENNVHAAGITDVRGERSGIELIKKEGESLDFCDTKENIFPDLFSKCSNNRRLEF